MAPRQEILDSEDDGSDFGDGPESVGAAETHDTEAPPRDEPQETVGASHNAAGTDSTDPSFFQRIYNQQQHAAAAGGAQDVIPDTAPPGPAASTWTDISSAPPPGQKQSHAKGSSSLTSVTDPVPASRKSKRARQAHQSEVIDLTDITTPRKEAASRTSDDVWDVPPSTRSQRTTRTYGKLQGAQQLSLEQEALPLPSTLLDTQDPYAFPDATPPPPGPGRPNNNRRGTPPFSSARHAPQDSSPVMMLVPTEEVVATASSDRRARSSRKKSTSFGAGAGVESSSLPDTAVPPSLYVSQSSLTASQRQQYQVVSLSSEGVPEVSDEMGSPLAGQALGVGMGEMYKSSGATTIAYPTPSRAASLRRLPGVVEEGEGEGSGVGMSLGYDVGYQQSSPDVLTDMTTATASRSKRSRAKVVSSAGLNESELETPASTRRAKKRKVVREVEDEVWELDPLGRTQESNDAPQQNAPAEGETENPAHTAQREADVVGQAPVPEVEPLDAEPIKAPITTPKPVPKGKRGRKKKGAKSQEPAPELEEPIQTAEVEPEPAPEPAEATEPPAKRKRGRPRKSGAAKPQPEPEYEPQQQHTEEAQPDAEIDTVPQPLSEVGHNSQPSPAVATTEDLGDTVGDSKENEVPVTKDAVVKEKPTEKEKQAAKDVKSGALKVQYRVGLSKRSRIAPLLKCLKKPA